MERIIFPQPMVLAVKFAEHDGTSDKCFDQYSEDSLLDVRLGHQLSCLMCILPYKNSSILCLCTFFYFLHLLSPLPWQLRPYSDSLRAGRSGGRIPIGVRFSTLLQTGPGAHPASYAMDTESFPEVKRPGRGVNNPSPSTAEVKERVELYLYSLSWPSWPDLGWTLPLPLPSLSAASVV